MKRTHEFSLYGKDGAVSRNSHGGRTAAWELLAEGVPANIVFRSGKVRAGESGRNVDVTTELFVAPADLPDGVELAMDQAVVVTKGRAPQSTYMVTFVEPVGGGRFDDRAELDDTQESVP